ncbi:MAG: Gfo/Idh/MocA family oxidoreductase, partial [Planctomycetota bacterium]
AAHRAGVDSSHAFTDMRRLFDSKEIDAVVIATPDHWHAPAAILAADAGKHVYVEKPCSHNFRESQLLVAAARRNDVVVQHGTHMRSSRFIADAVRALREGVIGEVLAAKAWNIQRRRDIGRETPSDPPREVDYDLWVGPAEFQPFQKNRFHRDWHWWRNFGTGDIGNDGAHEIDYARWGLGVDALPTRVAALGGKYFFRDDQQFPDTATCVFEYAPQTPDGQPKQLIFEMRLWSRNYPMNCDSGAEFYGTAGQMFLSKRGKLLIVDAQNKVVKQERAAAEPGFPHLENFLAAIEQRESPHADVAEAALSVGPIHLANVAIRLGRSLTLNAAGDAIVGDEEADRLLRRHYREGGHWATPPGT